MQASLHRATLSYGNGLMLHTASSGPVTGLDTLYLRLRDGDVVATGEVRINIAYLNGLQADTVLAEALSLFDRIDWSLEAADLLADETIWQRRAHRYGCCWTSRFTIFWHDGRAYRLRNG